MMEEEAHFKDLRTAWGAGTDYFDENGERPFELKTYIEGMPKSVQFSEAQVANALKYGDRYVLVVAEHLLDPARTTLHLYKDPLRTLSVRFRGSTHLEGLDAQHVVYDTAGQVRKSKVRSGSVQQRLMFPIPSLWTLGLLSSQSLVRTVKPSPS
ncbi:MAG TPA: hypothetical protein DFR83_20310 [Deltaproteobacteria bacterium]|nr:hypothetical protein [Deltaproteobacteria bacterium]